MSIGQEYKFIIQWHLTERCNLRCTHCYQEGSRGEDLSLDEVRSGLDEIQDLFSTWSKSHGLTFAPSFNITGGEPLLRKDFFDILGDIADRGWDTFVLTNGTLVNPAIARRFADLWSATSPQVRSPPRSGCSPTSSTSSRAGSTSS